MQAGGILSHPDGDNLKTGFFTKTSVSIHIPYNFEITQNTAMNSRVRIQARLLRSHERALRYIAVAFLSVFGGAALVLGAVEQASSPQTAPSIQAPQPDSSPGTIWVHPKPPMRWSIDFKYLNTNQRVRHFEYRPEKVVVTVAGDKKHISIKCLNTTRDRWMTNGFAFIQNPENGQYDLQIPSQDSDAPVSRDGKGVWDSFQLADTAPEQFDWIPLSEFDWVKPEMLQGTIKQGNELLAIYADLPPDMLATRQAAASGGAPVQAAQSGAKAAPSKPPQKWPPGPLGGLPLRPDIKVVAVNSQTHQPHFLQVGEILREYTFSVPDANELELPPPVARMVKLFSR